MYKLFLFFSLVVLIACESNIEKASAPKETAEKVELSQAELKSELDTLEAELKSNTSAKIDRAKANKLIDKSLEYVNAYPEDQHSVGYLFRAAEVSGGIGDYDKALPLFEKLRNDYPSHEKAPISLFLQGFISENSMADKDKAKRYYNDFLLRYPKHDLAEQVEALLKNIDLSPEELVKSFQQKRQKEQ